MEKARPMANITDLTNSLRDIQAKWIAKDNNVLNLTDDKKKQLLGAQPPAGYTPRPAAAAAAAPVVATFAPSVDWRNKNGNFVTAVKNQGGCGSCVSFCTVAVTESMAAIEKGQLLDLSEADQHFCSSHGANCGGWWHSTAFDQIKARGVAPESAFPYETAFPSNNIWSSPPTCKAIPNRDSMVVKISGTTTITDVTSAKNYLTDKGPLAAIIEVYDDFFGYSSGIYHYVSGTLQGLHCVTIIGYNEAQQYWICKNSWGPGWGESGFFKIAYGQCKIDTYEKIGANGIVLPAPPHGWYGYEALGGVISSRPNAVSWAANRIDVVARGMDSSCYHKWWNGSSWQGWENLGGTIQDAPSICSWGNGRLDIFAMGTNFDLCHRWYQNGWSNWESLGGQLSSEPACVSWGPNRIDIFAKGMNSSLVHMWWDGAWHGWEDLGGEICSAPAVCSWGPNRLDVFAVGMDNKLWQRSWNGSTWLPWAQPGGGTLHGAPAAESWGPNRIDVFYPGKSYHMMHRWFDGTNWSGEEDLGGVLSSDVGVCSWAPGRLDCFVRGMDSQMYHKWYV
jgi:C1A family cysteine protease